MDGKTLQARLNGGYRRAAQRIGFEYFVYRPLIADDPLNNLRGTTIAAFDSSPRYDFARPNEYGDATWYALVDPDAILEGDYLIDRSGSTYAIVAKQADLPILAVGCNRKVKITRPTTGTAVGAQGYSSLASSASTTVIGANGMWPCSLLTSGRGREDAPLPASTGALNFKLLLPPSVPVQIMPADIITDDFHRKYAVKGAEQTDLGWRLSIIEVHT